jgi:UDP-N-acetylglucosamine--N-acetylmuramyl-(pentapeptide) pyrophosphoryl-undecaprenol N-acetylglucosamine transferase
MARRTILLAAGGTGGHLFPAEALAHELIPRGWEVHLVTDGRAERYAANFPATAVHTVASATLGSRNPAAVLSAFWRIWQGYKQSSVLLNRLKPAAVVGFGGYPTLPPVFAATRRGIPTLIHEQNAVMGRANRALAARVDAIAGGFLPEGSSGTAAKVVSTGNPVRPAVIEAAAVPYEPPREHGPVRLVVFGGSQGAQFFSTAVPAAIALLPQELRSRISVTQQARPDDAGQVTKAYADLGVPADISPFFSDIARRVAEGHLVMSRSGASTVSEVAAIGRPAILVPYPYALDHDQAANAAALAAGGGAEVHQQSSLTPERIAEIFLRLLTDPAALSTMAAAARRVGRPQAARLLADVTEAIAGRKGITAFRETPAT